MSKTLDFNFFKEKIKDVLHFEQEFTEAQWNIQYQFFIDDMNRVSPDWKSQFSNTELVYEFAKEFYQEATPDTQYYCLKN